MRSTTRDQEEQAGAVVARPQAPEAEHDAALVLGEDADRVA